LEKNFLYTERGKAQILRGITYLREVGSSASGAQFLGKDCQGQQGANRKEADGGRREGPEEE